MPSPHFDRALTAGAAFEVLQAARLVAGAEKTTELQPMLSPLVAHDPSYRRLWTAFTLILAYSRWSCVGPKASRQVKKLTLVIHLLETAFFWQDFKAATTKTPKMYALLAILTVMPSFLIVELYKTRHDEN